MLWKRWLFLLAGICLLPLISQAQLPAEVISHGSAIYGKIIDKATKKGIGFATVAVLSENDSAIVKGVLSKKNGDFRINGLPAGQYILKIKYLGYQPVYHHFLLHSGNEQPDLGNFILTASVAALQAVKVTAEKPAYTLGIDKKVFDVSKSITSQGGNALDILSHVPGVSVDIDGQVSLRNGSPVIFVDGKRTLLTLDEIPAESIEKIEVMTNPSAQYDASGMAGIINVVLKKNRKPGFNGMASLTEELRGKYKGGVNLNIYRRPLNLSLSYYMKHRTNEPYAETVNRHDLKDDSWLMQHAHRKRGGIFQTGQIGIDYYPDDRNTISLTGSLVHGTPQNNKTLQSKYLGSNGLVDSSRSRDAFDKQIYQYYSAETNYMHNFQEKGHELTADLNLNTYSENREGNYVTHFPDVRGMPLQDPAEQVTGGDGHATFLSGQVDYINPVSQKTELKAGLKATVNKYKSVYTVYDLAGKDSVFNHDLSSDYSFTENIYAAYIQFSGTLKKFGYELGLRAESYRYSGAMPARGLYFKPEGDKPALYPAIFLDYRFSPSDQLQLNYSRRVDRPGFLQRIPFTDYTDPQNLSRGNPGLKPEYTNSFELNYNKLFGPDHLLVSLYFKNMNHQITTYTEPYHDAEDTLITYAINANAGNSFGAELTFQGALTSWWNITADINLFQSSLKASVKSQDFSNDRLSWFTQISSNIDLPASFTVQLSGNYHAPVAVPQGTLKEFGYANVAVEKKFLKKKNAGITLTYADIFDHKKGYFYDMPGVFSQTSMAGEHPYLKINLTWNFGKPGFRLFKSDKKSPERAGNPAGQNITPLPGDEN